MVTNPCEDVREGVAAFREKQPARFKRRQEPAARKTIIGADLARNRALSVCRRSLE